MDLNMIENLMVTYRQQIQIRCSPMVRRYPTELLRTLKSAATAYQREALPHNYRHNHFLLSNLPISFSREMIRTSCTKGSGRGP